MKLNILLFNGEIIEFNEDVSIFDVKLSDIRKFEDLEYFSKAISEKHNISVKFAENEFKVIPISSIQYYEFID